MDRRTFLAACGVSATIGSARLQAQDEQEPDWSYSYVGAQFSPGEAKSPNSWPARFGTDRSISHNGVREGHPASIRKQWWQDPCKTSQGFSCYGPYEPMEAGEWIARWAFRVEFRKPRMSIAGAREWGLPLVAMDVVTAGGKRRLAGPARLTWMEAFSRSNDDFGRMGYDDTLELRFALPNKLDRVEIRIRSFEQADCFFAKQMSAEYVS